MCFISEFCMCVCFCVLCVRVCHFSIEKQTHQEVKTGHDASVLPQNHFLMHLHANSPLCCLSAATMELSKSLSHHKQDGFHPRASRTWKGNRAEFICRALCGCHRSPDSSSSIMEEGKQPGPFSICANVREKDRSQELTKGEVEEAGKKPSSEEMDGVVVLATDFEIYQRKLTAKS